MSGYPEKKKMLSPSQIDEGVSEVAEIARSSGARILLVGGVAMYQYGSDRFTADLDFASDRPIGDLPQESPLTFGGYQTHTPGGVPLDVIIRDDDYAAVFSEALDYARRFEGVPVPVVSAEYLAVMKMVARRPKDAIDLEWLLSSGAVDIDKARRMVKRLLGSYAVDDFNATADIAEWRKTRAKK